MKASCFILLSIALLCFNAGARAAEEHRATPAVVHPVLLSPLQKVLSLDGLWDFATDPDQQGKQQQWFLPGKDLPGKTTIAVPACWESQGHPAYTGAAWYRKVVKLPTDWRGQQIWLKIGAVNAQGWFWVNGTFLAHLNEYCGAFKYNITELVTADQLVSVVALVRNDVPSLKGLQNHVGVFGGLYRSVELEATHEVFVDDAYAEPFLEEHKVRMHVRLRRAGLVEKSVRYSLEVTASTIGRKEVIASRAGTEVGLEPGSTTDTVLDLSLNPCLPWSPECPQLYRADIVLQKDGKPVHGWTERFGVRKWEVRGQKFYLNNQVFLMRAFGDDWIYPIQLCSPASVEFHREHLKLARAFGFNYVRHHTHSEIPEFYEAADEAGIMIQPEYAHFYGSADYDSAKVEAMEQAFTNLITQMRRYVSLSTYCVGNEGWTHPPVDRAIYKFVKSLDPTRLMIHMDGGNNLPDNSDFTTSWGGDDKGFHRPHAYSFSTFNRGDKNNGSVESWPHVLHEYLNIAAELDPRLRLKWIGAMPPPAPLDTFKARLKGVGLSYDWGCRILDAGYLMQRDRQKLGLESARIVPWLDGYCFWTIADYYPLSGQGLLDPFWGVKKSKPEFLRQFNGPTAILVRGLPSFPILGRNSIAAAVPKRRGVFIIAGQSNASGHKADLADKEASDPRVTMFGNDYKWKEAYEPTDDPTRQVDKISDDSGYVNATQGHSFALKAAKALLDAGVKAVALIPCAKGGSSIAEWRMGRDPFDRATLFGSCNYRRLVAATNGLTALWWYQGESEAGHSVGQYIHAQTELVKDFRIEMGANLPIVYAQLAKMGTQQPSAQHEIAEAQRRLETGSGTDVSLPHYYMVATFDLPLADTWHLTQAGQKELGRRIALATRQHVYRETVDGSGPRLVNLYHPGGEIDHVKVVYNQDINTGANDYDRQFEVWDSSAPLSVVSARRDPADTRAVLITLAEKARGLVTVSYGRVAPVKLNYWHRNVVKGANDLPAPSFGPLEVGEDCCPTSDNHLHLEWVVSHFGSEPIRKGRVKWKLETGGKTLASGQTKPMTMAAGLCQHVGRTDLELPAVPKPIEAMLVATIPGTTIQNTWPLWLMQQGGTTAASGYEGVCATDDVYRELAGRRSGVIASTNVASERARLLVTDKIPAALQGLEQGKKVLFLGCFGGNAIDVSAQMGWWAKNQQTGTAVAHHDAFCDFPGDGYASALFSRLLVKAIRMSDGGYDAVVPLIVGDGSQGYLLHVFQAKAGRGQLFASSLNLLSGTPEADCLLDKFVEYVGSDRFDPTGALNLDQIKAQVETMADLRKNLNGWSSTIETRGTISYPSFLGPMNMSVVRLSGSQNILRWRTAPVPEKLQPNQEYTFQWLAGMGYLSQPAGKFRLWLGDRHLVDFEVTGKSHKWQSADGTAQLEYVVRQAGSEDTSGVMRLTVPANLLQLGETAELKVVPAQNGSLRWFSVYEFE